MKLGSYKPDHYHSPDQVGKPNVFFSIKGRKFLFTLHANASQDTLQGIPKYQDQPVLQTPQRRRPDPKVLVARKWTGGRGITGKWDSPEVVG